MKKFLFLFLFIPELALAQGGIGNKPRTDIVMLSQMTRDSLSDLVYSEILDLKHFAESNNLDSAALLIAYKDSSKTFTHGVNIANPDERQYAIEQYDKLVKFFRDFPDSRKDYFAVFKTKDTPSGQKDLYQIRHINGKKQREVSWVFYPIGDKLLFGSF